MPFVVLLDASVLVPVSLADTLLRAAEAYMYQPIWSEEILAEVGRTLTDPPFDLNPEGVEDRVNAMRDAFPDAMVDDYEVMIEVMRVGKEDRHIVAGRAQVIVTQNTRDFPQEALDRYRIEVQDPDTFLLHLFDLDPERMTGVIERQAADLTYPPSTLDNEWLKVKRVRHALVHAINREELSQTFSPRQTCRLSQAAARARRP